MQGKDAVTREQIIKWYRLSEMDDLLTESRIAMLGDFAIFARAALATAEATDAVRFFWQQHTLSDTSAMSMAELHNDTECVIRGRRAAPMTDAIAPTEGVLYDAWLENARKNGHAYSSWAAWQARAALSAPSPEAPAVDALTDAIAPTEGVLTFEQWADDYGFYDTAIDVHQYARNCAKDAWYMATKVALYPAKPGDLVQCDSCKGWSVGTAPSPKAPAVDALTTGAVGEVKEKYPNIVWLDIYGRNLSDLVGAKLYFARPASEPKAAAIHYPECWDTAAYPTVESALGEVYAAFNCTNHIGASEPEALTDRYVQRYNEYSGEGGGVCENDEGEYVKYSDYIALLADRGSEQS